MGRQFDASWSFTAHLLFIPPRAEAPSAKPMWLFKAEARRSEKADPPPAFLRLRQASCVLQQEEHGFDGPGTWLDFLSATSLLCDPGYLLYPP